MPKRSKSRNSRRSGVAAPSLALYLMAILAAAGIVWLISSAPPAEVGAEASAFSGGSKLELDPILQRLAAKLDLPPGSISQRDKAGVKVISVPVNRAEMDLTFANMIVRDEFASRGAELLSGKAEKGSQILTFSSGGQRIEARLRYSEQAQATHQAKKQLAIVVDDFGSLGGEILESWLELPPEVTFAIFSGLPNSGATMEKAHRQGRETLAHVPMEPIGYPRVNPGENPILIQMGGSVIARNLSRHLDALPLCVGINNHMGSLATTDQTAMGHVMEVLKARGLVFLDSRTTNVSIAYQTAQKARVTAFRNDLFLDSPDISAATLNAKIERIKALAASRNSVIAITHCHSPEKLAYLKTFISRMRAEGFTLVPLTRIGKFDVPQIM